jgi:hypothetical protein
LALFAASAVIGGLDRRQRFPRAEPAAFAAIAVVILGVSAWSLRPALEAPPEHTWSEVSAFLERETTPDARVFLEHIGLVGYRTDRYIYDAMGLVTPETVRLKRERGGRWLLAATRGFAPDVALYSRGEGPVLRDRADANAVWFAAHYRHAAEFEAAGQDVDVYFLRGSPRVLGQAEARLPAPLAPSQ